MAVNHQVDHDPFPRGYPDGYCFTTPALRLRLDLLLEHIIRGDSPVLLVGESGAGKTTLLHQLVTRADSDWRIVRIPAVASLSAEEFATLIGEQLGVGFHNLALVVVDDADRLGDESLRLLAELPKSTGATNLRLLLAGKPTLPGRFRSAMGCPKSRHHVHVINIPSFDRHEVARYIDMRLYHAGMESAHRFSRSIVDDIARDSHGCPGRINAIAGRVLRAKDGDNRWLSAAVLMRYLKRRLVWRWIP